MNEKNQKSAIVNQQSLIKIAVIGSGTMGSGIAQVAATAGCEVKIFDTDQEALLRSKSNLEKILSRLDIISTNALIC